MADLITISDQASKSIREDLFPTLVENWWRTSDHPVLKMLGMEIEDATTGDVNKARVKPVQTVGVGRQIEIVHEHGLFGGGYGVAEGANIIYSKRAEDRSKATTKFYEGGFKITRADIAATRDNKFALVEVVSRHAQNALHAAHQDVGRMTTYLDNGVLCKLNGAVTASSVITVNNTGGASGTSEAYPTRYIRENMYLWIGTTSAIQNSSPPTARQVSTIKSSTVFTLTTTVTQADQDSVVKQNAYDNPSSSYTEFASLYDAINNTGTFQTIDKSANFWFASYVGGSVGTLAQTNIDQMFSNIRNYSEEPGNVFMMGNQAQWRRYGNLLTSNKRVMTTQRDYEGVFAGGLGKLMYYAPDGEVPFFLCDDVPDGYIYAVDPDGYFWAEMLPLGFSEDALSMEGTPGQRIQGTNNYEFAFRMYGQFVQTNAKSSGVLTGITG